MPGPDRDAADDPLVGSTVAHYVVLARLGAGGMGVVYRAHDNRLARYVALKVLPPGVAGEPERRSRFLREARSGAAVQHPNIATVYEVDESAGRIYLAMELVAGETLHAHLRAGPLGRDEALRIALEIARGLARAHDRGIIHRDLKPANVMITPEGGVKILDFGLAKLREPADDARGAGHGDTETQEGRVMGTPEYMSPEQAAGRVVDARTDVYALGVVLHEMLTGARPAAFGVPPRPIDADLVALLRQCLAREPEGRFADAGHVAGAIEQSRRAGSSHGRRRRWLAGAGGIALAVAAATAIVSRLLPHGATPSTGSPTAAPRATTLADLPMPKSDSHAALAEYAAGMQLLRDASWFPAAARFEKAAQLDPGLGVADLRAAVALLGSNDQPRMRADFQRAADRRDHLGERDQAMLDAFEPLAGRRVADKGEAIARFERASRQFPGDEELVANLAVLTVGDPARGVPAADRAVALDPAHADAWQSLGDSLAIAGRLDEARAALERCSATSVESSDCIGMLRAAIAGQNGQCAEMDRIGLHQADLDPGWGGVQVVNAKLALGRPEPAIRPLYEHALAADPSYAASPDTRLDVALAIMTGRFDVASRLVGDTVRALARSDDTKRDLAPHRAAAEIAVALALEVGDEAGARQAAGTFKSTREALVGSDASPGLDATLWLDELAGEALDGRRSEWIEAQLRAAAPAAMVWVYGWALPARTADEARAAVDALARDPRLALPLGGEAVRRGWAVDAEAGRVLLLAGEADRALPILRRAASSCFALQAPYAAGRARLDLGRALEKTGDVTGACGAYRAVLAAWGRASPRSTSAEAAREGATRLACPP